MTNSDAKMRKKSTIDLTAHFKKILHCPNVVKNSCHKSVKLRTYSKVVIKTFANSANIWPSIHQYFPTLLLQLGSIIAHYFIADRSLAAGCKAIIYSFIIKRWPVIWKNLSLILYKRKQRKTNMIVMINVYQSFDVWFELGVIPLSKYLFNLSTIDRMWHKISS